jgi:carbamoyl-phosphate synthase/aspartate carbamoyltransferase
MSPSIVSTSGTGQPASSSSTPQLIPYPPVSFRSEPDEDEASCPLATLLLQDGASYQGYSFGAEGKSVAGELVFQTGMLTNNHFYKPINTYTIMVRYGWLS